MNSFEFFEKHRQEWDNKSGIYIIEFPPISKEYGKKLMKVGMATHSLSNRMSNYKTSYSIIPFTIHALYEIPTKVVYKASNYQYISEQILHATYDKMKLRVYGEWFLDLKKVLNGFNQLRLNHLEDIKKSINWTYSVFSLKNVKFPIIQLVSIESKEVLPYSKLKKLIVPDRENLTRTKSEKVAKSILGLKGMIDMNNETVSGIVESYNTKYFKFEIQLENEEVIELNWDDTFKFIKLQTVEKDIKEVVKENKEKDKIVLRSGKEILKK